VLSASAVALATDFLSDRLGRRLQLLPGGGRWPKRTVARAVKGVDLSPHSGELTWAADLPRRAPRPARETG
jgi:hypothetical protein